MLFFFPYKLNKRRIVLQNEFIFFDVIKYFILISSKKLVHPAGFEPTTNRIGICHSIQLNYGCRMILT